jgi:hypothetical protein
MSNDLRRATVLSLGLLALVAALAASGRAEEQAAPARRTLNVLFIGNSYTYFNNLGDIVSGIAAGGTKGPAIRATLATRGGATLQWHLDKGSARQQLASGGWDFVVLQEQSSLGGTRPAPGAPLAVGDPQAFHAAVREWARLAREVKATPILYMTWAPRDPQTADRQFQSKITEAYQSIGRELGVRVAPVGLAWVEARRRLKTIELHIWDGAHPTAAGSYLAGCVIYATLTGQSPIGAPALITGHPMVDPGSPNPSRVANGNPEESVVDATLHVPLVDLREATATELQKVAWQLAGQDQQSSSPRP